MKAITILAHGQGATPFAAMLARFLEASGHTARIAEAPTGSEHFCIVDIDSIRREVYEDLPTETTLLYTTATAPEGTWGVRTMVRPFSLSGLAARLPRPTQAPSSIAPALPAADKLAFEADGTVTFGGEMVPLTKKETILLRYLYTKRGTLCTREEIVAAVWNHLYTGNTNLVDVYIRYLRTKLDEHYHTKLIYAIRGKGYMLK